MLCWSWGDQGLKALTLFLFPADPCKTSVPEACKGQLGTEGTADMQVQGYI